jgi:fatty-acid peroxygenase
MALMLPERIELLDDIARQEWRSALQRWRRAQRVILLDEAHEVLCRAVCRWSGVPLPSAEVPLRTADFAAMIDGGGAIGPRHWRSRAARARAGRWAEELIRRTRGGEIEPEPDTALAVIAYYRDMNGRLLEPRVAAVDLLNVLRPTVAVGTYVTFAALALHRFPESRPTFTSGSLDLQNFVNEVRRYFPFFPFQAAMVGKSFEWRGFRFPKGRRVLLDLYGTDHDERVWEAPYEFRPERFETSDIDAFALVPQGGGDPYVHHRCAGEWITLTLLKGAVEFLEREAHYRVPEQDLTVSLSRMPAMPKSGFVIEALPPGGAGKRDPSPVSGTGAATAPQKPH